MACNGSACIVRQAQNMCERVQIRETIFPLYQDILLQDMNQPFSQNESINN